MQTCFWRASAFAFAYGATVYGLPVALLHVLHNRLGSLVDALLLALVCALLYGLMAMTPTALAAGALSLRRWLRGRRPPRERLEKDWGLRLGLVGFTVLFWEAALLYGLTYEQTLLVRPRGFVGMALYLAVAAVLIAIAASGIALRVESFFSRARPRAVVAALVALPLALLGAQVAAALTVASPPTAVPVSAAQDDASEADAGVADAPEADAVVAEAAVTELGGPAQSRGPSEVGASGAGGSVVLVGFDGLDPEVVDRLVAEGELPTFAALREDGVWGAMETLHDSNSAVIWASIYTGKPPLEHGILDFYRIRLPGLDAGIFPVHRTFFKELVGMLEPIGLASRVAVGRADLREVPIWEIADHYGLAIGVADGYLYSYPALEPQTPGSWFLSYALDAYAGLLRDRQAEPADAPLFVQPIELLRDPFGGGRLPSEEDCEWQARATLQLLERRPLPRLLNFYCHQPDTVQHESWTRFEPWRYPPWRRPQGSDDELLATDGDAGDPITRRHRRLDAFLGDLRERLGPDVAVLVLSDHGHSPTIVHKLDTQHRHGPPGAFAAFGGPFRRGLDRAAEAAVLAGAETAGEAGAPPLPHVFDVMPTVLHLLGLPVAEDMPGRVLAELLAPDAGRHVRTLPTYQGLWQPRIRDVGRDRRLNELEIEKLRKLGYVL
ncbi:MAG TPA: alkaline phosphatase family protein [Thermoanaerobaculia bacterium]|nr:alkaline phosphatase family protein [Thermoanaerobaculia bacterium]